MMTSEQSLTRQAENVAAELLPPMRDRWLHVQAVAKRAQEAAVTVPERDRDLLVASAWLHDIGYAPRIASMGFHPVDGARYVGRCSFPARLAALVAHQSAARIEAEVRGVTADLAAWPLEDSPVTDALAYADMTTGPQGQRCTVEERIAEILTRYPPEHAVHRTAVRSAPILREYVRRVEDRLAASAGQLT